MIELERSDIQGLIFSGYKHQPAGAYIFLRLSDRDGARAWLRSLLDEVTTAEHRPKVGRKANLNVAFTSTGLLALGLSADTVSTFPIEFQQGMATPNRARQLGDTGDSAPETWDFGGPDRPVDALLFLFGASEDERAALVAAHRARFAEHRGVVEVALIESVSLGDDREHFGFRDGISQPSVEGVRPPRPDEIQTQVKPGEFVLGYTDEYAHAQLAPTMDPDEDPDDRFPVDGDDEHGRKAFARNGSYVVCRKLHQDVGAFWSFLGEKTRRTDGAADEEAMVLLGAKCMGRWPSGVSLVHAPDRDPGLPAGERPRNDFNYGIDDQFGQKCPVTAHVRRAHPRDGLPPDPERSDVVNRRHRMLRRGKAYGPPLAEPRGGVDDGADRGTLFICLQSNLRRQFEFVQQTWLNNAGFDTLYTDRDPIAGAQDGRGTLTIPGEPFRTRYAGVPRFVRTRGGGYFFLPGVKALRWLADGR